MEELSGNDLVEYAIWLAENTSITRGLFYEYNNKPFYIDSSSDMSDLLEIFWNQKH